MNMKKTKQLILDSLQNEESCLKDLIVKLIKTIVHMEEECENEISFKMKEVEKKILGLQKGKKISKGYGAVFKNRPLISRKV